MDVLYRPPNRNNQPWSDPETTDWQDRLLQEPEVPDVEGLIKNIKDLQDAAAHLEFRVDFASALHANQIEDLKRKQDVLAQTTSGLAATDDQTPEEALSPSSAEPTASETDPPVESPKRDDVELSSLRTDLDNARQLMTALSDQVGDVQDQLTELSSLRETDAEQTIGEALGGGDDGNPDRFVPTLASGNATVNIGAGTWRRKGADIEAAATPGIGAPGTPYIVATLDNDLVPTTCTVAAAAAKPTADEWDVKRLLCTLTYAAGVITVIVRNHLGDIDDTITKPDTEMTTPKSKTLVEDATTKELHLRNAELAASQNKWAKLNTSNELEWADLPVDPDTDVKAAVDSGAAADFVGATYNTGFLHVDNDTITKADGGDFITLAGVKATATPAPGTGYQLSLLPPGGSTYMVLQKKSNSDYNCDWDWVRAHA